MMEPSYEGDNGFVPDSAMTHPDPHPHPNARFFAIEGIDGAGTSTQLTRMGERLVALGYKIHLTAEPSGGPIGKFIRTVLRGEEKMSPQALALLFAADRLDHLQREILPALAQGAIVLSDRYVHSSLAYQSLELPLAWVESINAKARVPDATLFVKVSAECAARRRQARGGEAELFDADETQRKIAQNYEQTLGAKGLGQTVVVDGEGDIASVSDALWLALQTFLPAKNGAIEDQAERPL